MSIKSFLLNDSVFSKSIHSILDNKAFNHQKKEYCSIVSNMSVYKDIYKGQRCFIIGTGPSLRPEDLEVLMEHNEICFGSNRIYEIFDQTIWRPTYYSNQDFHLIEKSSDKIKALKCKQKFLPIDVKKFFEGENDITYFILKHKEYYPNDADFSFDLTDFLGQGFTVTYGLIQIARYMGFKDIYLLGIDHNYAISLNEKGVPIYNNDVKDYFEGAKASNIGMNLPRVAESTVAYMTAERVSKNSDFRVYNATRGGKLEAFERVDFNSLF